MSYDVEWLLDCTPREVQKEALRRSYYGYALYDHKDAEPDFRPFHNGPLRGWGHTMEMRLGKTPTSLNEMELLGKHHDIKRGVVLSPNTYKYDWVKEPVKFGVTRSFFPFETSKNKFAEEFLEQNPEEFVMVINYEALQHAKGREMMRRILKMGGSYLYIDESIKIKNHKSQTTMHVLDMATDAEFVRTLTGKPMTQGPQDLYPQIRVIGGLNGKVFYSYRNKYCKMGGFKNKKVVGVLDEEGLKELLNKHMFIAKRKDWGKITIPEYFIEEPILTDEQAAYYEQMDKEFLLLSEQGDVVTVDQVISKMLKLQQISSGFIYDEYGDVIQLVPPKESSKIIRLLEMLEETDAKSVICFHYQHTGDILTEALKDYNPHFIVGKAKMKKLGADIMEEKRLFNSDPSSRVMLVNIDAAKYGHDLTGNPDDRTTNMFFYENTFSLDSRSQVEMRVTANEQDWVNYYFDFASSQVERNAVKALAAKESLVEAVMGAYR